MFGFKIGISPITHWYYTNQYQTIYFQTPCGVLLEAFE